MDVYYDMASGQTRAATSAILVLEYRVKIMFDVSVRSDFDVKVLTRDTCAPVLFWVYLEALKEKKKTNSCFIIILAYWRTSCSTFKTRLHLFLPFFWCIYYLFRICLVASNLIHLYFMLSHISFFLFWM